MQKIILALSIFTMAVCLSYGQIPVERQLEASVDSLFHKKCIRGVVQLFKWSLADLTLKLVRVNLVYMHCMLNFT